MITRVVMRVAAIARYRHYR